MIITFKHDGNEYSFDVGDKGAIYVDDTGVPYEARFEPSPEQFRHIAKWMELKLNEMRVS